MSGIRGVGDGRLYHFQSLRTRAVPRSSRELDFGNLILVWMS